MADKYITSSQYEKGIRKMKEYVDKSIPHKGVPEVIFTIPANTVLEINNSETKAMEFDKPSNINIGYDFIVNYNNEDFTDVSIEYNEDLKMISMHNDDIIIKFVPGYDINQNINENKMVVAIIRLNPNITPTDVILKQINKKCLNNKYLKRDVAIKNSITIGSRDATNSIGQYSFSNGKLNTASGLRSHAEGYEATASGEDSHAEGHSTTASGLYSHAEGSGTNASGDYSHAEGVRATASGKDSHAEGHSTTASGEDSHAEGYGTTALGESSHAEGNITLASGLYSHAEGDNTIAKGRSQHAEGKFNIEDTANAYAHIVGNGSSNTARSNAHTLDWSGNAWYKGKLSQDGIPTENKDLTTKKYVDDAVNTNKINMCTDEEITNMLTEVLGAGYSATE